MGDKIIGISFSGGGAHGAWTAGVAQGLNDYHRIKADVFSGTSTGALVMGLSSINEHSKLYTAYTTTNNKNVYTVNPYKNKKNGYSMNIWSFLKMRFLKDQPTFGDTTALKDRIDEFFTYEDYKKSRLANKILIVCVVNLTKRKKEYYSNMDGAGFLRDYEDFKFWMWVSTLATPLSSIAYKNGDYYVDGGFMEHLPIQTLIDNGATEIYAISTKPKFNQNRSLDLGNDIIKLLGEMISCMLTEISIDDVELSSLKAKDKDIKIHIIQPPTELSNNPMNFDSVLMSKWYVDGYSFIKDGLSPTRTINLRAKI